MGRIMVCRIIQSQPEVVFRTVADIRQFSKAVPGIIRHEFLSGIPYGMGARFSQTRVMNGKETTTELEVVEFIENSRIRLIADDGHGTLWDTVFSVEARGVGSSLSMVMETRSRHWIARVFVFLILGMVRRAVQRDMDSVREYCENACRGAAPVSQKTQKPF